MKTLEASGNIFEKGPLVRVPLPENECKKQNETKKQLILKEIPKNFKGRNQISFSDAENHANTVITSQVVSQFGKYLSRYSMRNLFDGNPHTAWVEGIPGSGIGITWEIGSNIRELTFQKIKVVNGYAKDKTTFENNNRIREIVIFSPFTKPQTIKFDDSPEIQIVSLKEPFKAPAIVFMIKSVYKGKKYDDTGLSELRFITQELEEWPTPPNNVIETYSFVSPPNFLLEWDAYTYPSYDIYAEGIERGNIASDFLSFDISSSGWAFVTENSEAEAFSLLYLPDVKGPVDIHWTHLFLDKIDSFEQTVTEEKSSTSLGWFERDQLCVMKEDHDAPTTFFVYQIENKKLKLKKTVQIPLGQTEHLWKDNEKKFSLGGKYQILFRSFCPVSKN